jgi:hypothetical protein
MSRKIKKFIWLTRRDGMGRNPLTAYGVPKSGIP